MLVTTIDTPETNTKPARGEGFSAKEHEGLRRQWDKLQGDEHNLDYERAKLLHRIWARLDRNDETLETFLVDVLYEYKGKRCKAFIRLAHAFDRNDDAKLWRSVGGAGMVLLTKAPTAGRRGIVKRINGTLARTKREVMSVATFRNIASEVLGGAGYRKLLTETHGVKSTSCRQQLAALKGFLIQISALPAVRNRMTPEVKALLGLDLVE